MIKSTKTTYISPFVDVLYVEGADAPVAASWNDGSIDDSNWNEIGEY